MWDIDKVAPGALMETGEIGLKRMSGHVYEDFVPKLKNLSHRIKVYEEMITDPTVGAILFAIELHMRKAKTIVKPGNDTLRSKKMAEFVEECMLDMEHTWQDFVSEVLSMIPYGFSVHELVYKVRDDGRLGWRKIPIRAQNSIIEWDFSSKGDILGFVQRTWNQNQDVYVPLKKCVLFRPSSFRNNPEGKSALRTCYSSWYFKKKLEVIEAIGIERDLTGYPVIKPPMDVFGNNSLAKEMRQYAESMVTRIRKDEQMGAVLPPGWELELIASPGRGTVDTGAVINRYDVRIAQSMLADVIMLGHVKTGSYALADTKYNLLMSALKAWLDSIFETFNRQAIPELMRLNGWTKEAEYPKLAAGPIEQIDPLKLSNVLFRLAGIDAIKSDNPLEEYLRDFLGLPQVDWDEREKQEQKEQEEKEQEESRRAQSRIGEREDNINRPASTDGDYTQRESE